MLESLVNRVTMCTGLVYPGCETYCTTTYDLYCPSGGGITYPDPTPTNPGDSDTGGGDGEGGDDSGSSTLGSPIIKEERPECTGGKINSVVYPFACVCPVGKVEDENGICVDYVEDEIPCPGDPVKNPKIAEKEVSGLEGGRCGCTRTGGVCDNSQEGKDHGGTDVLNDYGEPVYAMFDGVATAVSKYYEKGAGWIAFQTAKVNGQEISIQYFHLQENNRVSGSIKAGDIIGYQGDSENLAGAIAKGTVKSHVHIKIKDKNGNSLDPEDFMSSNPTSNINNCN